MSPIKNLVNFKKIPLIISVLFILILGVTSIYFVIKASKLSLELRNQKINYEKFDKYNTELKNNYVKLQNDYNKLQKDYEAVTLDRDNLKAQARNLLKDRERATELESNLEKTKKDIEALEKERQELVNQNLNLEEKIKDLAIVQRQLITEKEQLAGELAVERDKSGIKKLEQERASLKKENNDLANRLKQAEVEINKLRMSESKTKEELKKATESLDKLNKNYAEAVRKNKLFEKNVMQAPTKFAEIARQNKALIKETANMHYNLGVFYTKQKEYSRAVAEFEKAIELTPDDAYSHFNLGYIYAEYLVNRQKAIEHFQKYLRYVKKDDKDVDWVKKYILTWESWQGQQPME